MNKIFLLNLCFFSYLLVSCQTLSTTSLKNKMETLANHQSVKNGNIALSIKNASTGKAVFDFRGDKMMNPASILKLLTSTAVLHKYAKNFTIKTTFGYNGEIANGVLDGNLVIRGNGDPTIGSDKFKETDIDKIFENVYFKLVENGVNKIEGGIIADAQNFGSDITPSKWLFEDIGNYYGTGCAAINIFENQFKIIFESGKTGEKTKIVGVNPEIPDFDIINEVIAGTKYSGDNAYVYSVPFANQAIIRGTIPSYQKDFTIKAAISDPAKLFAKLLYEYLTERGIEINGIYTSNYDKDTSPNYNKNLYMHESPPLEKLIYWMNMRSINLYAESLAKNLSSTCSTNSNTQIAMTEIYNFLSDNDIYDETVVIYDASGLSPMNRISCNAMCNVLSFAHNQPFEKILKRSISVAGTAGDGNMAYVLKETPAAFNLQAKSGYMSGVRSYAGYFKNKKNEPMTFTFIANDYTCKAKEMKKLMLEIMKDLPLME